MTQEHFENLTAIVAAGLVPIFTAPGNVTPERLAELTKTARNVSLWDWQSAAGAKYRAANGVF